MAVRLMEPALSRLLLLQSRGKFRRTLHQMCNPQRAALTWFAFGLLGLFLVLELIALMVRQPTAPDTLRTFLPWGMLGVCLLKLSRICLGQEHTGVTFRSADVVLLQAGPFTHRAIRTFKISAHGMSIAVTALFASAFVWADVHYWLAGFGGALSAMLFMYLVYMLVAVAATYVPRAVYNRGRLAFCVVAGCAVMSSLFMALANSAGTEQQGLPQVFGAWPSALAQLAQTPVVYVLLSPFRLFTSMMLAGSLPELVGWSVASVAVNGGMFFSVLYLETWLIGRKVRAEQESYVVPDSEGAASGSEKNITSTRTAIRVPRLPWLAGAGPIAWRQLTAVHHNLVGVTLCATLFAAVLSCAALLKVSAAPGNGALVFFVVVALSQLLLPGLLPFDFRRDVAEMGALTALPIAPRSLVVGQLLVPVAIATLCQIVVVAMVALLHPQNAVVLLAGVVFYIPANFLIFGLENFAFLLYPYNVTSFDMQTTARRALMLFAKFLVLLVALVLAVSIALAVVFISQEARAWGMSGNIVRPCAYGLLLTGWWLALLATWLGLLRSLCWAFRRFDPSTDRAV